MNYSDFFKKNKAGHGKTMLPEGVNIQMLKKAIIFESASTKDLGFAAKIALKHLTEDADYYDKLSGDDMEPEMDSKPSVGPDGGKVCGVVEDENPDVEDSSEEDSDGSGEVEIDVDSEEGMPKVGGALAIPHLGQPIHMSKIVQIGKSTGQPATGELSGYTSAGGGESSDKGGIPVKSDGDKETITAGGKKVDSGIASKTVGGDVVAGEGQKQGGPNTKGSIAGTPKLNESKKKLASLVKEALKDIRFDKASGKFVIKEDIKKNSGKVDMKMGASYKVVQPTQCKTVKQDTARTNQYEPEITEGMDDEEVSKMKKRFDELVTAKRNLKQEELSEMNKIRQKLSEVDANGTSYKVVSPLQARVQKDDLARTIQSDPQMTEVGAADVNLGLDNTRAAMDKMAQFDKTNPTQMHQRRALGKAGKLASPEDVEANLGKNLYAGKMADLDAMHREIDAKNAEMNPEDKFDTSPYRPPQEPEIQGEPEIKEAGTGTVQHRSFRTIADAPQNPDARWDNEIDEGSEPKKSATVKQIEKSNKGTSKSKPLDALKHKPGSKTKSGIVLQKK